MEKTINIVGTLVCYAAIGYGVTAAVGFLLKHTYNILAKHFPIMWNIVEYIYYKDRFKEFLKEKELERHLKAKQ